jgi:selenophosphate synthase
MEGRKACADAGIIAGGHSIDNPEPILDSAGCQL